jgi:hypothetical protein
MQGAIASNRNDEIVAKTTASNYAKYSAYDDKWLTGFEVIRLITEAHDKDLTVYITGVADQTVGGLSAANCSVKADSNTAQYFDSTNYLANSTKTASENIYNINNNQGDIKNCWLYQMYANTTDKATRKVYHAYLVYNSTSWQDVKSNGEAAVAKTTGYTGYNSNATVTGVYIVYN